MGIDEKLYNEYLNGKIEAFETLYLKYKDKIKYFIFNIIKDYEKSEDIMQEVFIYVMNNKYRTDLGNFKYYIYMIAKTKSFSYINTKIRRDAIDEKYLEDTSNNNESDVADIIIKEENKKELLEAIELINDKYKSVIYLSKIEEFSYKEISTILNLSLQDVKNYVHRGKKELRKILIKKGFDDMNKTSKLFISILCLIVLITGSVYATIKVYNLINKNANLVPAFTNEIDNNSKNNIWIGSFQIAWNEFINERIGRKVEFEDGESILVKELNKQSFTEEMLSNEDYYIKIGRTTNELKEEILSNINKKFGFQSSEILSGFNFNDTVRNGYTIYSILYKKFEFLTPFDRLFDMNFNNSSKKVKYFGIENGSSKKLKDNVEVLFHNDTNDFAVKLKTKEGEEVILYANDSNLSFNELYNELNQKTEQYNGLRILMDGEQLRIPYIDVNTMISYSELCNRIIKYTNGIYISNAIQNVSFSLNEKGGNMMSEGLIIDQAEGFSINIRHFNYNMPFVLFLKESNKSTPYFALKLDNTDLLVYSDEK